MTFHFTESPVIDNHCHALDPRKATLDPASLACEFYHGMKDLPQPGVHPRRWEASETLRQHLPTLGVVQTMIFQLSKLLGCAPELAAVAAARNRHTAQSFSAYAELLYEDAGIVGTVLDSGLPPDDPLLDLAARQPLLLDDRDDLAADLLAQLLAFLGRAGIGQQRRDQRRPARRQRSSCRPDVQRRDMPMPHILLVHGIDGSLLERKGPFDEAWTVSVHVCSPSWCFCGCEQVAFHG